MELVSVVLPTYNRRRFVGDAIDSVLRQTYEALEVIVVDGGSDDGTRALLRSIDDDRLTVLTHDQPRGLSAARNAGIEASSGEYIVFLDDDDRLLPEAIGTLVETIRSRPSECGGVYTAHLRVDASGRRHASRIESGTIERFEDASIDGPSCTLIRRAVVDEIGGFDESFPAREDTDFWVRLFTEFDMVALDRVLYERRFHAEQMINDPELMARGNRKLIEKHADRLSASELSSTYYSLGRREPERGRIEAARSALRTALRYDPTQIGALYYYLWLHLGPIGYAAGTVLHHRGYRPIRDALGGR